MSLHRRPDPTPHATADPLVRSRLKVQHLSTLVSLGRHRNAHRAAQELNLSQPAVSKIVREIEDIFGARLFDRGRNGMHPNRLGEVLLARAVGMLNELENTRNELEAVAAGQAGYLRLGVIPFVTPALIARTLRGLRREGVRLATEIREGTTQPLVEVLLRKELDCVIGRYASEREADLDQRMLYYQRFSVVVSRLHPTLGRARRVSLADTMDFGWIVPPPAPRHGRC